MADRSVSVRLRADVSGFIAGMREAAAATRQLKDEVRRAGHEGGSSFEGAEQTAQRLERALARLAEAEQQRGRQQRQSTGETRRSTEEANRNRQAQDQARRSTDQARDSLGRLTGQTEQSNRQLAAHGSMLASAYSATGLLAAAELSAGVAIASFGALAVPSIGKVVAAQQDMAGQWSSLSEQQQTTALSVQSLSDQYQDLARSFEPQAMSAFNSVLATGRVLLPQVGHVAKATAGDVQALITRVGDFASGPEMSAFLRNAEQNAPQALHELGTAATTTGSLALRLATDLTPVGMSFLSVANGALGLVNGLAHVNPALAQLAVTGLLLRAPLTGLAAGVGNVTTRMRTGLAATRGLTAGQRALNLVTRAGPGLFVAAGVGLAFFAMRAANAKSSTETLIEALRIESRATGNNLEGHKRFAAQLDANARGVYQRLVQAQQGLTEEMRRSSDPAGKQLELQSRLRAEYRQTSDALDKQRQTIARVEAGSALLSTKYSITRAQALSLATAAGVDLSAAMDKNGRLTNQAAAKIDQYRISVEAAKDPTRAAKLALDDLGNEALSLKDRMNAATAALDAFFNPSIAAYQAATQLKTGMRELVSSLASAKGRIDGTSDASLQLQQRFASELQSVAALWQANNRLTKGREKARATIAAQLPVLYALAGGNRSARAQVDALARSTLGASGATAVSRKSFLAAAASMGVARGKAEELWREFQKIKSKHVSLTVTAQGTWTRAREVRPELRAKGGPIPMRPGASRAHDSVPALLRVDEHVWTPEEVDAVGGHAAMYRLRALAKAGRLQGYATGGRVALSSGGGAPVNAVYTPIRRGMDDLIAKMGESFAAAWKKFAGTGGPVVAAARAQIGKPYVWGAAGPDAFDCSGLTSWAWRHGGGKDITRTTYTQRQALTTISTPIPGAVGQPHPGHTYLYAGAGRIIEAPRTGLNVRETSVRGGEWWGYPKARGGAVTRDEARLADRALGRTASRDEMAWARVLRLAGDPGRGREQHTAQIAPPGPVRVWAEPETAGEAYIPLASSKRARSTQVLGQVARKFGMRVTSMADGGILGVADGGVTGSDDPLNLGDFLSSWQDLMNPASAGDVTSAKSFRKTQAGQYAAAKRALAKAKRDRADRIRSAQRRLARARRSGHGVADARDDLRKAQRTDKIRDAERRLRKERDDLANATKKLSDTERRYQYSRMSPATRLGAALDLGIKNSAAFIANLQRLADRGFGGLARNLLAMGGAEAEKIAADAVKLSDGKLRGLQGKMDTAQQQQGYLKNLPNILTVRSSMRTLGAAGGSWVALLNATGLGAGDLAAAVHLMAGDLAKTGTGQLLLADMKRHGYARGGWVGGPAGVDRVPVMATAGEYIVNRRAAARHAPLVEAINADQVGAALIRHYARGGWVGAPVRGSDGASAGGTTVNQTFVHHELSVSQLAREAAREAAWMIR